jgi:dinuclear metal center YbgI/SA1388 family protein
VTLQEFQNIFERLVPPAIAWKGDNVGLQFGNRNDTIRHIVVALDPSLEAAQAAKKHNANLIVTHHPLYFHPIKNITSGSRIGELSLYLARNKINLYSAHTNLDSVRWGVNGVLAEKLGLTDVSILSPLSDSLVKISVFVPQTHTDAVASAMHGAGAGMFSKYDHCSFRTRGTGTFRARTGAKPFVGTIGALEKADEHRLEMLCESWKTGDVLAAMRKAHPYEEIAHDIYPLTNTNTEYGLGAIGNLPRPVSRNAFLSLVKKRLGTGALRYTAGGKKNIRRVAVCGGSGSELTGEAIRQHADAMITADIKYHAFQEYEQSIMLVDAGHYETERLVLPALARRIGSITAQQKRPKKISITLYENNPVHYHAG